MIKKLLSISFSVIYLTIIIGLPISIHHCHGHNEISIAIADEAECSCATSQHVMESCCMMGLDESQHFQTDHQTGCCSHETKVVHFDLEQQLAQKEEYKVQIVEMDLFDTQLLFENKEEEVSNKSNRESLYSPPLKTNHLQILNQEFIFYG